MLTVSRFAPLCAAAFARLAGLPVQEQTLPSPYARASHRLPQGELWLDNRFVTVAGCGELRGVCIHAPKIDIITLFFFPQPERALPVFAMEFVVLGQRPIVAVIDALCLAAAAECSAQTAAVLHAAHAAHPDLLPASDPPDWYRDCRSGLDFFVRPRDAAELERLGAVCLDVFSGLAGQFEAAPLLPETDRAAHARRLQAYKDHHRQHSPGLPLLQRSFGAAWTETYLAEHLFR